MKTIKYRELRRRYELDGPAKTVKHLSEAIAQRHVRPEDFSLRDLAEGLVPDGHQWVRMLDPRNSSGTSVLEAEEAVDVTAFLHVAGQIVYSKILEAYRQEAFVVSKLVDTIPTRLDGERIPGIGRIKDEVTEVHPGMPYPHVGFGEDYIETPQTTKRGLIVPVTKEAVFFDRTHLILQRAAEVGEVLGLNKAAILVTQDHSYNMTMTKAFQDYAAKVGIEITTVQYCSVKDTDLTLQLTAIASSGAEYIFDACNTNALAVATQLFSAAVSALLRTRRGRDLATFLILGMGGGAPSPEMLKQLADKMPGGLPGGVIAAIICACLVPAIALLTAIAIPNFIKARDASQRNIRISNMRMIHAAKESGCTGTRLPGRTNRSGRTGLGLSEERVSRIGLPKGRSLHNQSNR